MNRIHEQCLKIDSGTVLSQTGSKTGSVHQVHSPQPNSTPRGAQVHAHGRIVAPPSAVSRRVVAETPAVSQACMAVSQRAGCRVEALTRVPLRTVPRAPCPAPLRASPCRVAAPCCARAQRPYLRTQFVLRYKLPFSCPFSYNTPECIAIQCPSAQHPVTIQ